MAEQIHETTTGPELSKRASEPKGVLQKNLKPMLYLGAALLVIVAAIFSGTGKKTQTQKGATPNQPPQPTLQDSTDNNVQDLKNQVAAAQQKAAQQSASPIPGVDSGLAGATPAQQAAAQAYGPAGQPVPCTPGQTCAPQQGVNEQPQLTPAQQETQQLAARDRALDYDSRFASNLVFAHLADAQPQRQTAAAGVADPELSAATGQTATSLVAPRAAGDPPAAPAAQIAPETQAQRRPEVNIDAATGQPYVIYEGTTLDTVLMNRLDGDAAGPVKVLVSNPIYSHDRQHVLIPEGTIVLGEAKRIGSAGFGQQRRMAVVFHRLIMPDGYSVDLDQFHGLDQIGEEGLKDKVNNHYLQIFGTSIALGVIAGAGEIEEGGGTITTSGSQAFTTGAASGVSQSATTVLDRFMQIPPTITIREGHRVKVYMTQDMLLRAYENHTISQTY
ncbi:MAG TPA: TrbI/VirB10 family protein [Terracidiphilus sp.]|jgi:type IV secretion system protein VirB10|nr:TrbI/VirB10 family protein [Terracidiphilus sp.]